MERKSQIESGNSQIDTAPWYDDGLKFSCTQCGNCCTGPPGYVWFSDEEAQQIAEYLGLSLKDFLEHYAHPIRGRYSLNETPNGDSYDCVFLKRDEHDKALCSIYPVRPTQCRTWPFWPENLESPRAWQRAGRTCPGMDHGKHYPAEKIRIIRDSNPPD